MKLSERRRMEDMVTITERAKNTLLQFKMSAEVSEPHIGLRLSRGGAGQLDLVADVPKAGDLVVEHLGTNLLFSGREVTDSQQGATIDCRPAPGGMELSVAREGDNHLHLSFGATENDREYDPDPPREIFYQHAHPAPIVRAALDGRSECCRQVVVLFVCI
jgi:hypothetical protein